MSLRAIFDDVIAGVAAEAERQFSARLAAVAVFGSVGRGTMRRDSDIDLFVVLDQLPHGAVARHEAFRTVEEACRPLLHAARAAGVETEIAAVLRTPQEISAGSPLMFDMVADARIIFDRDGVLAAALAAMGARLERAGAKRMWQDGWWYWDLKPGFRPGDSFTI